MANKYLGRRTESEIIKAICHYLKARRHFFWRHNNVGVYDKKTGVYRKTWYGLKGVPDLFCIYRGKIYGLEAKKAAAFQSRSQIEFECAFNKNMNGNGIYKVVRSTEDVIALGL